MSTPSVQPLPSDSVPLDADEDIMQMMLDGTADEDHESHHEGPAPNAGSSKSAASSSSAPSLVSLPQARVKRIMRADPEVKLVSSEAVLLVTKAAEMFVEFMAQEACERMEAEKKKAITYNHVAQVVKELDVLDFLSDILPEKVRMKDVGKK